MLKELTLAGFKEKFPQINTYGLEDPLNVFLENGKSYKDGVLLPALLFAVLPANLQNRDCAVCLHGRW